NAKKSNIKSKLERIEFSHISNFGSDTQIFGDINICSKICPYPKAKKATKSRSPTTTNPDNIQPKKNHKKINGYLPSRIETIMF
ncbi:MAG: hypothetical protein O4804_16945, partial [Trichodesmium sp. St11_bin5]|nr:hypothetical protein [Trichodesmium sp. St11_bin5]